MTEGPRPLVMFGPSGSGKSTLQKKIFDDFPDSFGFSVSHTTRKPRLGEQHGVHYYFTDWDTMRKDIEDGKFIEHAIYSGNHYGTSKAAVEAVRKASKVTVTVKIVSNKNHYLWSYFRFVCSTLMFKV